VEQEPEPEPEPEPVTEEAPTSEPADLLVTFRATDKEVTSHV
jgi:hypothetical protein